MLGKLLKKDFYATCRFFVPLLCGYGVAAAVGKILFEIILSQSRQSFDSGWFNGIVVFSVFYMIIFSIYFIACYLMTSVFIVYDFYKTMVSDHGYLTHTLPVKTSSLIIKEQTRCGLKLKNKQTNKQTKKPKPCSESIVLICVVAS